MNKPKLIVICGPTATGKSDYAVKLAREINGEVISADSRQIYRGMDIGSGKITPTEMDGVPHYGLDIVDPTEEFSVAQYTQYAQGVIADIITRGKTPILCGGTGFFIDAVIYDRQFPSVPPNAELRKKLDEQSAEELFPLLQERDPDRAETIDRHNKVRLIRALEIIEELGKVPPVTSSLGTGEVPKGRRGIKDKQNTPQSPAVDSSPTLGEQKISTLRETPESRYDAEIIYIDKPDQELRERIEKRLVMRLEQGMVDEVRNLHDQGVSWKRLESFGLEYRYIAEFLQDKITYEKMIEEIKNKSWQYVKRQRTWFKKYLVNK
ncbi:MAG: tRNA (adenosine(37)-N6)-dimethylallyltransferase MiaA [Candidatus Moranbacteria bacterium]|nr:tRNA (adenosine(37)-N6)-dimethylallyltransferase MiaA [Candidatus Moranbacteria bacterium]